MKRNLLLWGLAVGISILLSQALGGMISFVVFGPAGFEGFFVPEKITRFINSFSFLYLFFVPLILLMFGVGKRWLWTLFSVSLILAADLYTGALGTTWLWSLAFFVSGVTLAQIINILTLRLKKEKTPDSII